MIIPQLKTNNKIYCGLLLILGFILTIPLLDTRFIPGHDSVFHIMRIESIAESLKAGIFPVRMYVNPIQFWGAPVGIFYPNLFLYVPALLKLTGLPIEVCYNIFIATIIIMGLYASWYGFSLLTKSKNIGLLSSILYISSGYYLLDAYIRNALGELTALSFMPLALACISNLTNKTKVPVKIYILTIMSISAIIESHILSTIFLALFSVIYIVLKANKVTSSTLKSFFFIAFFIFMLNASFLVPFFVYYTAIPLSTVRYIENFNHSGLKSIIILRFLIIWNFWLFASLYIILSTRILSSLTHIWHKLFHRYFLCLAAGLFFLFASSELFPWSLLTPISNLFKFMQFSWRFLGYSTLLLSACGGVGLYLLLQKIKYNTNICSYVLLSLLICSMNIVAFIHLKPAPLEHIFIHAPKKLYWNEVLPMSYSDLDFYDYLYNDTDTKVLANQKNKYFSNAIIKNYQKKMTKISFDYFAESDSEIVLPLMNFPGYIAKTQTGETVKIHENNNHMIVILLPKGEGRINIHYEGLPAFKIADSISVVSLLLFIFYIFKTHKQNNWNKLI